MDLMVKGKWCRRGHDSDLETSLIQEWSCPCYHRRSVPTSKMASVSSVNLESEFLGSSPRPQLASSQP